MENQLLIALGRNKLLKNADISKIDLRGIKGRLITIGEGEILFREGDSADIIYLVTSGEINILKKRLLGKTKSYIFAENEFFGHEEFFEETSRTSTAVALRDSYLIALSRDEVESLMKQDDEILINLREPIAEIDDETLFVQKAGGKEQELIPSEEVRWAPNYEEKPVNLDEPEKTKTAESKNLSKTFPEIPIEEEKIFLNVEQPESPKSSHIPDMTKEFNFDESAFLNEDGIPKAEFELPDEPVKNEQVNSVSDLNDALFNILSGNTDPKFDLRKTFEEPAKKEDDEAFFASFETAPAPAAEPVKQDSDLINKLPAEPDPFELALQNEIKMEDELPALPDIPSDMVGETIHTASVEPEEPENPVQESAAAIQKAGSQSQSSGTAPMNADELQMIIKAAELVNSNIRVDEVLKNIVDVATDLTHADRGTLYLVDKEKMELWSLVTLGDEMREIRLKIGEGLAGYVAKTGGTVNIKDVKIDSRFNPEFDRQSGYTTKNMICFPIRNNKQEIIGVLQLLNSANGEFTKRDEEFLAALSIHSAIALNNAELVEKLLQAERIQSLGKMANFLIQDIKKPILVSKRYAEHLKTKSLPADTLQVFDMLLEQLGQVADLVQTTSSYSEGKTVLRTLNVSLNNTLTEFASRIEQYVTGHNSQLLSDFDKDVTIKLDVKEFYQAYQHIVKNGCDAMPDGGKIFISTKRGDKKVEIFFKDSGLGIPDGFKEKIFEPFMSLGKKEGTGLGLSITRKIIEAHNGTITAEGASGAGATFIVTLPIAPVF
jgi:signal transduction histidine kinase